MIIKPDHPLITLSQEIIEICKPLQMFDVHHFTYQKQFRDGQRISLSNKPAWILDYYNLNLFGSSLFETSTNVCKPRHDIWIGEYDLAVYKHGKQYYDSHYSISIMQPHAESCELYIFATSTKGRQSILFLANNMDLKRTVF